MKFVVNNCPGVKRRLELEGHSVGAVGEATWRVAERLPEIAIQSLGFERSKFEHDILVVRAYVNGCFGSQLWLGIPVVGLMDGGKSAKVDAGCAGSWVRSEKLCTLFERPELGVLLSESKHLGFVTIGLSLTDLNVSSIWLGAPEVAVYNLFEGVGTTVGEFIVDPLATPFKESWTVSILISRYPFPRDEKTSDNAFVGGVTSEVEKHLWLGEHTRFKNAVYTQQTKIGVVTAWYRTLSIAAQRALGTCSNLVIENVQYRTDVGYQAGQMFGRVKASGLLDV